MDYEKFFDGFIKQGLSVEDADIAAEISVQDSEVGVAFRTPEQIKFMQKIGVKIERRKRHTSSSLLRGSTYSVESTLKQFG